MGAAGGKPCCAKRDSSASGHPQLELWIGKAASDCDALKVVNCNIRGPLTILKRSFRPGDVIVQESPLALLYRREDPPWLAAVRSAIDLHSDFADGGGPQRAWESICLAAHCLAADDLPEHLPEGLRPLDEDDAFKVMELPSDRPGVLDGAPPSEMAALVARHIMQEAREGGGGGDGCCDAEDICKWQEGRLARRLDVVAARTSRHFFQVDESSEPEQRGSALFYRASFVNCCDAGAHTGAWEFDPVGKAMTIRAIRELAVGDELTFDRSSRGWRGPEVTPGRCACTACCHAVFRGRLAAQVGAAGVRPVEGEAPAAPAAPVAAEAVAESEHASPGASEQGEAEAPETSTLGGPDADAALDRETLTASEEGTGSDSLAPKDFEDEATSGAAAGQGETAAAASEEASEPDHLAPSESRDFEAEDPSGTAAEHSETAAASEEASAPDHLAPSESRDFEAEDSSGTAAEHSETAAASEEASALDHLAPSEPRDFEAEDPSGTAAEQGETAIASEEVAESSELVPTVPMETEEEATAPETKASITRSADIALDGEAPILPKDAVACAVLASSTSHCSGGTPETRASTTDGDGVRDFGMPAPGSDAVVASGAPEGLAIGRAQSVTGPCIAGAEKALREVARLMASPRLWGAA